MDAIRWRNVVEARGSYAAGEARPSGWPLELILEISARCNLRCPMCAINYDSRHQPRSGLPALFKPELFERLRPLFPTLLRAHLYGLGEPVLNRHLPAFISELHAAGVTTWFTTNATLIDEEKATAFAAAGADRISVSIDGATAETYEAIRRGATFELGAAGARGAGRGAAPLRAPPGDDQLRGHGVQLPRAAGPGRPVRRAGSRGDERRAPLLLGGGEPRAGRALPARVAGRRPGAGGRGRPRRGAAAGGGGRPLLQQPLSHLPRRHGLPAAGARA